MRYLDCSFATPEENLACEEVLLDSLEQGKSGEILRFWESPVRFVVLGTAQEFQREVHERACVEDGVPVLRRCTAGGCVLQGPGCLNFSLMLALEHRPEIRAVRQSYDFLLGRIAAACQVYGVSADLAGICDLAIGGVKVSGNAQRRRRRAILHHGTLLYRPDYDGMTRYLREPNDRPEYRGARDHAAFVGAFPLGPDVLRGIVRNAFDVEGDSDRLSAEEIEAVRRLAREKYLTPEWTRRR